MTESDLARKVMSAFDDKKDQFEVIKHADRFRKGVPDISVTGIQQTWWLELKIIEAPWMGPDDLVAKFRERVMEDIVQFMTMRRLSAKSGGRAFYLAFDWHTKNYHIAKPELFAPNPVPDIWTYANLLDALETRLVVNLRKGSYADR